MAAYFDATILNQPETEIIPWADPSNAAVQENFVDSSLVGDTVLNIGKTNVTTRPLKVGNTINLLGISQHPGQIDNGRFDITDQIALGAALSNVYVAMSDGATTEVYKFSLLRNARAQFRRSVDGSEREMHLNFITRGFTFDGSMTTVDGSAGTLFTDELVTPKLTMKLGFSISGTMNINDGDVQINPSKVELRDIFNDEGDSLSTTAGAGKVLADKFKSLSIEIIGYDMSARRSNTNWRTPGTIIDSTSYRESFAIPPGYPISVLSPVDSQATASKLAGMVNAARIRNSNNAVSTLLNYAEHLKSHSDSLSRGVPIEPLGAARHLVKPTYMYHTVDLQSQVISLNTHGRALDIAAAVIQSVRRMALLMYRESNYGPALNMANAGVATKPHVLIGTDAVIARHLMVEGEEKLMGPNLDFTVVDTNDSRMVGKVLITFTTGRPGCDDALSFGVHAYIPELIQRVNLSKNNATFSNDRIIPRSMHIPVLPVLGVLNITNLDNAIENVKP